MASDNQLVIIRWKSAMSAILRLCCLVAFSYLSALFVPSALAAEPALEYPPQLSNGRSFVTVRDRALLVPPEHLEDDVVVATEPPTIDFLYFPGQTYPGKPWSNWGDSLAVGDKYYASIGDHLAPRGNAFVYEYDPAKRSFRLLADVARTLDLPEGHYVPGKIHTRLDIGADGWIYFGTHRGSTKVTDDAHHFLGDWIMRCHPKTATCEIVARCPIPKHCIPTGIVDGKRMVFYGSTAPGSDAAITDIQFLAYDLRRRQSFRAGGDGPARAFALASSTGHVYFTPGKSDRPLLRFDPTTGQPPVPMGGNIGLRAASHETADGVIYTVASGQKNASPTLYALNTKTAEISQLGTASVGSQGYVTSLDADAKGRYLYYVPGAHGGAYRDGTPVVQYDIRARKKKVLAFLEPYFATELGCSLRGTYSVALSAAGDTLYITWNASRGSRHWDCCALTVVHIPAAERRLAATRDDRSATGEGR